jgi:hypothetical protein
LAVAVFAALATGTLISSRVVGQERNKVTTPVTVDSIQQKESDRVTKTESPDPVEDAISDSRKDELIKFVTEHQPGVARMLNTLERRAPVQYQKALTALDRDVRRLETLQKRDPEGYELGLNRWKNRSAIDLTLAKMALRAEPVSASDKQAQLDRLRQLVERREELRIAQARLDFARARSRADRLQKQMVLLQSEKAEGIQRGVDDLVNRAAKMRRGRSGDAGANKTDKPGDKAESGESSDRTSGSDTGRGGQLQSVLMNSHS